MSQIRVSSVFLIIFITLICFGAVDSDCTTPGECSLEKNNVFKVKSSVIQHRMQDISMSIVGFVGLEYIGLGFAVVCCALAMLLLVLLVAFFEK